MCSLKLSANGRNIVGCYMSVATVLFCTPFCMLLDAIAHSLKPVKLLAPCKWPNCWAGSRYVRLHLAYGPVHKYPFSFENGDFFLRFGLLSTRIRWKRSPKTHLFKNALQSYVQTDENVHALWVMLPYFYCLAFSRIDGRKRFEYIRYLWTRTFWKQNRKISVFCFQKYPDTCGWGLN